MTDSKITDERLQEIGNDACDQLASPKYGWSACVTAEEIRKLVSAYAATSVQKMHESHPSTSEGEAIGYWSDDKTYEDAPHPAPVVTDEQRALDALKPFYDAVFNDNGDITVTGPYDYEVAVAGYFAYKRLSAALQKQEGGE